MNSLSELTFGTHLWNSLFACSQILVDFEFKNVHTTALSIMSEFDVDGEGRLDRNEMTKVMARLKVMEDEEKETERAKLEELDKQPASAEEMHSKLLSGFMRVEDHVIQLGLSNRAQSKQIGRLRELLRGMDEAERAKDNMAERITAGTNTTLALPPSARSELDM